MPYANQQSTFRDNHQQTQLLQNSISESILFYITNTLSLLLVISIYSTIFQLEMTFMASIFFSMIVSLITNAVYSLAFRSKKLLMIPYAIGLVAAAFSIGTLIFFGMYYKDTSHLLGNDNIFSFFGRSFAAIVKKNSYLLTVTNYSGETFSNYTGLLQATFDIPNELFTNGVSHTSSIWWFCSFLVFISILISFHNYYYKTWFINIIVAALALFASVAAMIALKSEQAVLFVKEAKLYISSNTISVTLARIHTMLPISCALSAVLLVFHFTYSIMLRQGQPERYAYIKRQSKHLYMVVFSIAIIALLVGLIADHLPLIILLLLVFSQIGIHVPVVDDDSPSNTNSYPDQRMSADGNDFDPNTGYPTGNQTIFIDATQSHNDKLIDADGNYFNPDTDYFKAPDGKYYKKGDYVRDADGNYYRAFVDSFRNWDGQYVHKGDTYRTPDGRYHKY